MTREEVARIGKGITLLAETLNEPMSELRLEGYILALSDLPFEPLRLAIARLLKEAGPRFPFPKDIREMVLGTTQDAADLAWGDVLKAIRSCGRYGDPRRMLDETAHAAMLATFGSWGAACDMSLDGAERQGCAKQFRAVYGATVRRQQTDALTLAELPEALRHEARALLGGR